MVLFLVLQSQLRAGASLLLRAGEGRLHAWVCRLSSDSSPFPEALLPQCHSAVSRHEVTGRGWCRCHLGRVAGLCRSVHEMVPFRLKVCRLQLKGQQEVCCSPGGLGREIGGKTVLEEGGQVLWRSCLEAGEVLGGKCH